MQNNDTNHQNTSASAFRHEDDEQPTASESPGAPLYDLTGFQRDLLRIIADVGPTRGTRIKECIEREYNGQEINVGRFYPNLNTLADKGLISKRRERESAVANSYDITARGRRELENHCRWFSLDHDLDSDVGGDDE